MKKDLCGWAGKILRVDLSSGDIDFDKTEKYIPQYIGGLGIGLKIMWDEVGPQVKPYDPENLLIFAVGPLTATWVPCTGRTTVVSKSPVAYPINHVTRSSIGGHFGAEIKLAGLDLIVLRGKAKEPVYLSIKDEKVTIKKALKIWGTDSFSAQKVMIEQEKDLQAKSLAIGQAGENCSYLASITSGTGHSSGQGGFGGVMGAKNLKGIVVRGTGAVRTFVSYKNIQEKYQKEWKPLLSHFQAPKPGMGSWAAKDYSFTGAGIQEKTLIKKVNADEMNRMGLRTIKPPLGIAKKYHMKNDACFGCLFGCFNYFRLRDLPHNIPVDGQGTCQQMASYFPLHSWDFKDVNVSTEALFFGKQLADMYTINSSELRTARHLLIYLKNGYGQLTSIQRKELESLPWESEKTNEKGFPFIWQLTEKLAHADYRADNLWGIMSRGTLRALRSLGIYEEVYNGIDEKYNLIFNNNGFVGHLDPRTSYFHVIPSMMENRDPNRHDFYVAKAEKKLHKVDKIGKITEKLFNIKGIVDDSESIAHLNPGKIFFSKWLLIRGVLKDSLTLCDSVFPNYVSPLKERDYCGDLSLESKFYSAVTGDQLKMEELDKLAEGVWNLQRALTIRDWQTRDMRGAEGYRGGSMGDEGGDFKGHDNFPAVYYKKPKTLSGGGQTGKYIAPLKRDECERAKSMFYREMGWDINGAPTRKTLESFNLKDIADQLDQDGLLGT